MLTSQEAHIWLAYPENADDETLLRLQQHLNHDERQRATRFRFDRHRREYVVAHALLRVVLSRNADVAPQDWQLIFNEHGKPSLAEPRSNWRLHFNLSHTKGLTACVIALERSVGIDVESLNRNIDIQVAQRFFADHEIAALNDLDGDARERRFLHLWTLKEAYMKGCGKGITMGLKNAPFEISKGEDPTPEVLFRGKDSADWQFDLQHPRGEHALAVAIHRPGEKDLKITSGVMELTEM